MLISNMTNNSRLYDMLNELGIIAMEEHNIELTRRNQPYLDQVTDHYPITAEDIERVGYRRAHFTLPKMDRDTLEFWVDGTYIYPDEIEWIETDFNDYGLLPEKFRAGQTVAVRHNESIFRRFSEIHPISGNHSHTVRLPTNTWPLVEHPHPDRCCYCIVDGELAIPTATRSGSFVEFTIQYAKAVDMFFCGNLVGIFEAKKDRGFLVDRLESRRCYHNIQVDYDSYYPVSTRFYPWISVDKDCIVRVYNTTSDLIPHPEITRIMTYPEFFDVADPYHTDNAQLNALGPLDTVMRKTDSDEELLAKFREFLPRCYRVWEHLDVLSDEQSNFLVCDNARFGFASFIRTTIHRRNGSASEAIISLVPREEFRDILWYAGLMWDHFEVVNLKLVNGEYIETPAGQPSYVLDPELDPDQLAVIKFNTAEDTLFVNVRNYVDPDNVLLLHHKLNRFYRNLLVLRGDVIDAAEEEFVRVSTTEPETKDEHLWFELLTNAEPAQFALRPVETIQLAGLDEAHVPSSIREGALVLEADPEDGGPKTYTSIVETYFQLTDKYRDKLVLQTLENYSNISESYDGIPVTDKLPENPKLNDIVLVPVDGSEPITDLNLDFAFTMSLTSPAEAQPGDIWLDMQPNVIPEEHPDYESTGIYESTGPLPDNPEFSDEGTTQTGTIVFDAGANGGPGEPEIFRKVEDDSLHQVQFGGEFDETAEDGAIWYEFLDEINNRVCYADTESLVLRVDERLLLLQFDHDNITAFLFDDILMNFNGRLSLRYLGVLADLVNSGDIDPKDMMIFHNRLITSVDSFDPGLRRLYTGRSHVVSTAKVDARNYSIGYSSNVGRLRIAYPEPETMAVEEREDLWRHVINYRNRELPFLPERMLLFVNGRFTPAAGYERIGVDKLHLKDFPEIIRTVDVFYNKKDYLIAMLTKLTAEYWAEADLPSPPVIQRPERNYATMETVEVHDHTKRGYYDVLLQEYILNGRLASLLHYFAEPEHVDEFEAFRRDLVRKFHAISDVGLLQRKPIKDCRIMIPCFSDAATPYTIK